MGYSHYWRKQDGLDKTAWEAFMKDVGLVLADSQDVIQKEDDDDSMPVINSELIRFNGIGDDGHETFFFENASEDFAFCKTACKPYDMYVTACLILAKHHFGGDIIVSSDGDLDDWADGENLVVQATDIVPEVSMNDEGKVYTAIHMTI